MGSIRRPIGMDYFPNVKAKNTLSYQLVSKQLWKKSILKHFEWNHVPNKERESTVCMPTKLLMLHEFLCLPDVLVLYKRKNVTQAYDMSWQNHISYQTTNNYNSWCCILNTFGNQNARKSVKGVVEIRWICKFEAVLERCFPVISVILISLSITCNDNMICPCMKI